MLAALPFAALVSLFPSFALSDKEANKALSKVTDQHLDTLAAKVVAARSDLMGQIDVFVDDVLAGANPAAEAAELFDEIFQFQSAVYLAILIDGGALNVDAIAILDNHADGADLKGQYPKGFRVGRSGMTLKADKRLRKILDKSYKKLDKRFTKASKKLAKKAGVGLTVILEPAAARNDEALIQGTKIGISDTPLRIHAVLAIGRLDTPGDVAIHVAGLADPGDPADVRFVGEGPTQTISISQNPASELFEVASTDGGSPREEGNTMIYIRQGTAISEPVFLYIR